MERRELVELLTPTGLSLVDEASAIDSTRDVVATVAALRKRGHDASLVATALTQARLRRRARGKFGAFADRMLFTEAGLEQATRLRVAALHAGRFRNAGVGDVADIGCGIGGDAMAIAGLDIPVTAVDADEVTAAIASYNLAPFPEATVRHARAEELDLDAFDALWFDPARRTAGHGETARLSRPEDWSPSLDLVQDAARRHPTGVKLGPGLDRDLIPDDAEAQWVSVDGSVVELCLWFGKVARPGVRRAALVLDADGAHELTAAADSDDEGVRDLGAYLHEPDGAVIRARLIGDLSRSIGAAPLSDGIAYLTSDDAAETPFATTFRVIERLPLDVKALRRVVRDRGIGTLEIKKRGVDVDPADFRRRLAPRGDAAATLVLTRVAGRHCALLVERV